MLLCHLLQSSDHDILNRRIIICLMYIYTIYFKCFVYIYILFRIYFKKRFVDRFVSIVKKNFLINNDIIF